MTKPKEIENHLITELLKEMFRRVGREYSPEIVKKEDWYLSSEWTEEEQNDFRKWGSKMVKTTLRCYKRTADRNMWWFLLNYGWKTKGVN